MGDQVKAARKRRVYRVLRKFGWHMGKHDPWITGRLYTLAVRRGPWYDWGHPLMILVGDPHGGNYDEPSMRTWWYRLGPPKHMWRTRYPRNPLSTFEVIKDYETFRQRTEGLNESEMYEWQALCIHDGELTLGHRYWGGTFYGMRKNETALLRRYLRAWRRHDWYGLRSWLYYQALHAAVHQRKPFACHATPPPRSGGYSHWHCQLKRKHDGEHRFNAMTWLDDLPSVVHDSSLTIPDAYLTSDGTP
jgi:hypothetical protein